MTISRFRLPLHTSFAQAKSEYSGKEVVLFGRSDYCALVAESLLHLGAFPKCYCSTVDKEEASLRRSLFFLPQFLAPQARSNFPASIAVLATPPAEFDRVRAFASAAGWDAITDCAAILATSLATGSLVSYSKSWTYYLLDRFFLQYFLLTDPSRLLLPSIDLVVTERCSLRCRDCSNLMQYYKRPRDLALAPTSDAFAIIMNAIDYVFDVRILGGEPFMNRNLVAFLACVVSHEKVGRITVFTNGTIVPSAKQLTMLASARAFVRISDYGSLSRNLSKVTAALDFHQANYESREPGWQDCANISETNGDQEKKFRECCMNDSFTLFERKLYQCPFAANAYNLGALPPSREAALIIAADRDGDQTRERIWEMLRHTSSTAACRYCPGRPATPESYGHPVAIQTKSPLPYKKWNI